VVETTIVLLWIVTPYTYSCNGLLVTDGVVSHIATYALRSFSDLL
jgi:hypothetical protein